MMDIRKDYYEIPVGDGYREVTGFELVQDGDEHLDQFSAPENPPEWRSVKGFAMAGFQSGQIFGGLSGVLFRFRRKV